ncbi:MAG: peptide deformylase [Dehalococcoidales bacterium]|nr:peptide deformylase [Dehalococcoidales bacterium]
MAIREMRYISDPVLRKKAKRVPVISNAIQQLVSDMIETLQQEQGVGLAAPQVGVSLRIVVIIMPEEEPLVIINPKMVKRTGEREVTEGCLSIPGYVGEIKRSVSVTVKGEDRQGKAIRIKAAGLLAEALEHELDHLNGILYIDYIENQDKLHKVEPKASDEGASDTSEQV